MVLPADILPQGPNIYSCAGVFSLIDRGDGKAGQVDNALSITAFFVDLDGAPLEPVMSAPIQQNIIAEPPQGISRFGRYGRSQ